MTTPDHDASGLKAFRRVCNLVIAQTAKPQHGRLIEYAAAYAKAGLEMTDKEEIRVQCLYILNNLSGWRGEEAADAKAVLKYLSKNY